MHTCKNCNTVDPPASLPQSHQQMHAEHESCRKDNALWHEELKLWQDELKQARDDLAQALHGLHVHLRVLEKHGAALTLYAQTGILHEHVLAEFERGHTATRLVELADAHHTEITRHDKLRATHERLKRTHHTLIARCSLLLKAVEIETGPGTAVTTENPSTI